MNNYFLLDYKIYRIIYRILKLEFKDIEYNEELKKNINLFKNTLKQFYNPKVVNDKSLKSIMEFYTTDILPILKNLRLCLYQDTDIITTNNNIGKTKLPPTYYIKNYKITPSNMNVRI